MWEFFLELLREYGLAVVAIAALVGAMGLVIVALWKRNREQAKTIEEGGAAPKLDAVTKGLEKLRAELEADRAELVAMRTALAALPAIEELLETRYEARITGLETQVRELLEENRELQRKWREQASADLREMLEHVNSNREAVSKIAAAMQDMKDLLRR